MEPHEWKAAGGTVAVWREQDGPIRYSREVRLGPGATGLYNLEQIFAREILRLAGRVKELEQGLTKTSLQAADLISERVRDEAKVAQLRQQRDEEKRRADEAERHRDELQGALDAARSQRDDERGLKHSALNEVKALRDQVAEHEETRRAMVRKNLDLARERAALANRVKELEGWAGQAVAALEPTSEATHRAITDAAVQPYRDEVRHLNRQIAIGDERLAAARARAAELDELAIQRRLRIEELEQENRRLRDGIGRVLRLFASSTHWCSNLAEAGPILREALEGDASARLRRDRTEAVAMANARDAEPVTREELEEMSERVRAVKAVPGFGAKVAADIRQELCARLDTLESGGHIDAHASETLFGIAEWLGAFVPARTEGEG